MEVGGGWWCFSRALSQPVGDPEFISTIKTPFRRDRGLVYHVPLKAHISTLRPHIAPNTHWTLY